MNLRSLSVPFERESLDFEAFPRASECVYAAPYLAKAANFDHTEFEYVSSKEIDQVISSFKNLVYTQSETHEALSEKLRSPAVKDFFVDHVKGSELFANWILKIGEAVASEAAFGQFVDFNNTLKKVAKSDPFYAFIVADPMLRFLRERTLENARLMTEKERVMVVGAGLLPEIRHVKGYEPRTPEIPRQYISAFDPDSTAMKYSTRVRYEIASKFMNDIYLTYEQRNLTEVLDDARYEGEYDVILINGQIHHDTYSYLKHTLGGAYSKLAPGGKLSFDVKLPHWVWKRNFEVFGYNASAPSHLARSLLEITDNVYIFANQLGVAKCNYRYYPDTLNTPPVAVRFVIEKPA